MSYYRYAFTARLVVHRIGHLRYRAIFLPRELEASIGLGARPASRARGTSTPSAPAMARRGRVRMTGEIADVPIEAAWQPAGAAARDGYYIMVSPAICRAAGLDIGAEVEVRFNLADPTTVTLPDELAEALHARRPTARAARRAWEALTPGRQRAVAAHVASARTTPTRMARVTRVLDALAAGDDPLPRPPRRAPRGARRNADAG